MVLEDIDLSAGLQEVRNDVVIDGEIDLPAGDGTPGGLLSGPDKSLAADEQIDEDLLQDAKENINNQPEVVEEEPNQMNNDDFSLEGNEEEDNPENCEDSVDIPDEELQDADEIPPLMSKGEHLDDVDSDNEGVPDLVERQGYLDDDDSDN